MTGNLDESGSDLTPSRIVTVGDIGDAGVRCVSGMALRASSRLQYIISTSFAFSYTAFRFGYFDSMVV